MILKQKWIGVVVVANGLMLGCKTTNTSNVAGGGAIAPLAACDETANSSSCKARTCSASRKELARLALQPESQGALAAAAGLILAESIENPGKSNVAARAPGLGVTVSGEGEFGGNLAAASKNGVELYLETLATEPSLLTGTEAEVKQEIAEIEKELKESTTAEVKAFHASRALATAAATSRFQSSADVVGRFLGEVKKTTQVDSPMMGLANAALGTALVNASGTKAGVTSIAKLIPSAPEGNVAAGIVAASMSNRFNDVMPNETVAAAALPKNSALQGLTQNLGAISEKGTINVEAIRQRAISAVSQSTIVGKEFAMGRAERTGRRGTELAKAK